MNWLPSAVHASSVIKHGASGDWKICFLLFSRSVPSPNMCICVYVYYIRCSCCCLYFVLCRRKRRSREESRHHEKGRTNEISVLSLLSSYLRWEVSKEGQLSYPNFVRGLLLDVMQPLVSRFEILGVLCFTVNEVPRRLRNQKEAGLRDPWNSVMWRKSKRGVFVHSASFRNFFES